VHCDYCLTLVGFGGVKLASGNEITAGGLVSDENEWKPLPYPVEVVCKDCSENARTLNCPFQPIISDNVRLM
jgi:hypothetical protein